MRAQEVLDRGALSEGMDHSLGDEVIVDDSTGLLGDAGGPLRGGNTQVGAAQEIRGEEDLRQNVEVTARDDGQPSLVLENGELRQESPVGRAEAADGLAVDGSHKVSRGA